MKKNKPKKSDKKGGDLDGNAMVQKEKKKKGSGGAEENAGDGGGDGGGVVTDPRFSAAHSDPRFRLPPRQQAKVPIDARFRRMFTDPSFASASAAPVDKRGRPKRGAAKEHPLLRYYGREEEEEEEGVDSLSMESEKMKDLGSDEESSSEESSSSEEEDSDVNYSEDDNPLEKVLFIIGICLSMCRNVRKVVIFGEFNLV